MSYVSESKRSRPAGMGAAILLNGSIILAVALSPLVVEPQIPGTITVGDNVPLSAPPPPDKPQDKQEAKPLVPVFVPDPIFETLDPPVGQINTTNEQQETGSIMDGTGGDDVAEIIREVAKPPAPLFKAAIRDPRFARNFQPDYPVGMLRLEIEGTVTIRVLIGADGRVRQAQVISATEPEFARATERQALKAWRFKPATRGGEPVEDWQTLTVRFDIT